MATKKCGCVPWDYPQLIKEGFLEVCEGWGRYCFESVLKDTNKRLNNCGYCLPDCIITRYMTFQLCNIFQRFKVQNYYFYFLYFFLILTRYSYSVSSTVLDINSICQSNSKDKEPFYANWYNDFSAKSRALPPSFMRRFQQVFYGVDIGRDEICKANLETGVAVVKFQLAAQTVTQIEKKLRYSESDYISNIGKRNNDQ